MLNAQCLIITTEILHKFLYNQSSILNSVGTVIFDEITVLLHHCRHSETQIDLIKYVYLFRTSIPEDIVDELNEIFNILSNGQSSINIDELISHLNEKEHPQCELMKKNLQYIKDSVIKGIKNIIGDKNEILREEFLEFHYNIFWVMPEYCHGNFRKKIALMWNVQF